MAEKYDIEILRHGMSHVLAKALRNLYKDVKFTIGPAIDNGFYYDIDLSKSITPEDFPAIEEEMKRIIANNEKTVTDKIGMLKKLSHPPALLQIFFTSAGWNIYCGEHKLPSVSVTNS